jgi:hypothetical protein
MKIEELKAALLNRDFYQAEFLIGEWGKSVTGEMKAASGETERRRILDDACAFAEQNICLTRVIRAHISAELQANSASFLYVDPNLEQPRWRLSG